MASFFKNPAEDVPSEAGDVNVERGQAAGQPSGAVFREDAGARVLRGRGPPQVDARKYRYDVVRGKGKSLPFAVSRDDRMSADEAGQVLHEIHEMFGIDRETEDILQAFDSALWFCHTVNGGSTLNPGRSKFEVPGVTQEFDYGKIRDKLGVGFRRFFRSYADDITEVNRRVLKDYDPYDPVKQEQWGWLMEVAHDRGLARYPYLAHDSADACLALNSVERQALQTSKALVIAGTPNSADRMVPTKTYMSQDRYDSSVGAHV